MNRQRNLRIPASLAIALLGSGILVLRFSGGLNTYIHSSSQWFVTLAALILLILGVQTMMLDRRSITLEKADILSVASLFAVALIIIFQKPVPLSVETAKTRASISAPIRSTAEADLFTRKTSEFSIIDWLAAFADPAKSYRYENTPADLSGFFLYQDGLPAIGRLVITCCGADAQPAILHFSWDDGLPEENSWIHIVGTMRSADGRPFLEASRLEIIPTPSDPYAK